MDKVRNPFNPGAGSRPPLLVGRDEQLEAMTVAIQRLELGRFERSLLLTGLRGVGKTVLLSEFGQIAAEAGWIHAHLEATDDIKIARAMALLSRRALLELSGKARAGDRARRALGVLRTFVKVHVPLADGNALTIDFEPVPGTADTGELDDDLGNLFAEVGATARLAGTGLLITIDEIQYLARSELSALIVALHRISQLGLPLLIAGAGLPSLPGLAAEARSYAERLFSFVEVGSLVTADARRALVEPVEAEGARWSEGALARVINDSRGYPYFLQEFGKQAWNVAEGSVIAAEDAALAATLALDDLDGGFFRARIDKTTDGEREYLRAMAGLGGSGPYSSGAISRAMHKRTPQTAMVRESLIRRGLCFSPRHGELSFTVPMFDDFVRRTL